MGDKWATPSCSLINDNWVPGMSQALRASQTQRQQAPAPKAPAFQGEIRGEWMTAM